MIMSIIIGLAAIVSTAFGGLFALRFQDKLHLILGFSAGAVLGVAFFDLLPESLELIGTQYSSTIALTLVAVGFFIYLIFDRVITAHHHNEHLEQVSKRRTWLGAGSLVVHSFLDGVAIGLAFKVSAAIGIIVAIAVLAHDFSDGINTVNMVLKNQGSRRRAFIWLIADSLAPMIGVLSTLMITLSGSSLGLVLSLFAGFFLYIGASELLPESHHAHPTIWTTVSTLAGVAFLYVAINFAGI
jgi:ZIP family zinc transporter